MDIAVDPNEHKIARAGVAIVEPGYVCVALPSSWVALAHDRSAQLVLVAPLSSAIEVDRSVIAEASASIATVNSAFVVVVTIEDWDRDASSAIRVTFVDMAEIDIVSWGTADNRFVVASIRIATVRCAWIMVFAVTNRWCEACPFIAAGHGTWICRRALGSELTVTVCAGVAPSNHAWVFALALFRHWCAATSSRVAVEWIEPAGAFRRNSAVDACVMTTSRWIACVARSWIVVVAIDCFGPATASILRASA
jgi:hypothetical protein